MNSETNKNLAGKNPATPQIPTMPTVPTIPARQHNNRHGEPAKEGRGDLFLERVRIDSRGRVVIPRIMRQELGLQTGTTVYLICAGDELRVIGFQQMSRILRQATLRQANPQPRPKL